MKISGNTMLITGGGSGIGRELARCFADEGNFVIVAGRRADALHETIGDRGNMAAMPVDLDDVAQIASFASQVVEAYPNLNVLMNNAGIMREENIGATRDLSDAEATITTNLLGPIRLIDAFVDHLKSQRDGAIINVTSGLAFVPTARAATYCATKAALHSYTLSLREKLREQVEVIELAPPGVQTDLTPGQSTREGYMPLDEFTTEAMAGFKTVPTPSEIAVGRAAMLRAAERDGRFDQVFGMLNPR
jgi:uncharacterized oxidoreductase